MTYYREAEIAQLGLLPMKPLKGYLDEGEFLTYARGLYGTGGWLVVHYGHGGGEDQPCFGPGLFYWAGGYFNEVDIKDCAGWLPLPKPIPMDLKVAEPEPEEDEFV